MCNYHQRVEKTIFLRYQGQDIGMNELYEYKYGIKLSLVFKQCSVWIKCGSNG